MSTLHTRFAGPVTTEPGEINETTPVVIVNLLSIQADLFPDESRALGIRLIEAAARAERGDPEWP